LISSSFKHIPLHALMTPAYKLEYTSYPMENSSKAWLFLVFFVMAILNVSEAAERGFIGKEDRVY